MKINNKLRYEMMNKIEQVCNQTPYQNGVTCFEKGMSVCANPFRNTGVDHPLNSYTQWINGWNDAKEREGKNAQG